MQYFPLRGGAAEVEKVQHYSKVLRYIPPLQYFVKSHCRWKCSNNVMPNTSWNRNFCFMTPRKVHQCICRSDSVGCRLANTRSASLIVNIPQMYRRCWVLKRALGSAQRCGAAAALTSVCLSVRLFSRFSCWVNNRKYVKHSSYSASDISVRRKQRASPLLSAVHIKLWIPQADSLRDTKSLICSQHSSPNIYSDKLVLYLKLISLRDFIALVLKC